MTLVPASSHGAVPGPGGGPGAPYMPASDGATVVVVKDFDGSAAYQYVDDDTYPNQFSGNVTCANTIVAASFNSSNAFVKSGGDPGDTAFAANGQVIDNVAPAVDALDAPQLGQLSPLFTVTSGALATVQLVTATAAQISTSRDVEVHTPVTFNPGVATTATCTVALSPDNVTFSTLCVWTEPVGVALDGTIHDVTVRVPAGWYLKLTVSATAVLGLSTFY